MAQTEPHILCEKRGALGLVTLNRPKALNALTHGMCIGLDKALRDWAADDDVRAVAIRGAGPRAFCAGGDIRALQESGRDGTDAAAKFLRDEYRTDWAIANFPKPIAALLHGFVMGGGVGVSIHGRYRLADASLDFAMPETGIGMITDIGASHFLPRCPGETGMYLALTGARIGADDALALGLVTHAVDKSGHDALIDRLAESDDVEGTVRSFARKPGPAPLAEHRARIDTMFSAASVEAILERLDRDASPFAARTAETIRTRSPSALKLTFRALRDGRTQNLRDCLKMEYRAAVRLMPSHDFQEGVRALLIDKDGRPRWQPSALAGVKDADIAAYFAPFGSRELSLAE